MFQYITLQRRAQRRTRRSLTRNQSGTPVEGTLPPKPIHYHLLLRKLGNL